VLLDENHEIVNLHHFLRKGLELEVQKIPKASPNPELKILIGEIFLPSVQNSQFVLFK